MTIELAAVDAASTQFTYTYHWVPALGPIGRLVGRLTEPQTRAAMERSLERFEELVR